MVYNETIGKTAGKIWQHVHQHGKTSLSGLEKAVKAPRGVVFMAVGWLGWIESAPYHLRPAVIAYTLYRLYDVEEDAIYRRIFKDFPCMCH